MQEIKSIGDKLRELRINRDESLEYVANNTGLTRSLLSKYERGLVDPGVKALGALAQYYSISLDWLFGFTEDPLSGLTEENRIIALSYIEYLRSKE